MKKYQNRSGISGVVAYEAGEDYIKVKFRDGPIYTYNYSIPGKYAVETMKSLALKGEGLSTFITREIRENYFSKS